MPSGGIRAHRSAGGARARMESVAPSLQAGAAARAAKFRPLRPHEASGTFLAFGLRAAFLPLVSGSSAPRAWLIPLILGLSIYSGYAGLMGSISSDALCGRRAVLAPSGGRLAAARRTPERFSTLARIVSFDYIPIARRLVTCGEPKQHRRAAFAAARADETFGQHRLNKNATQLASSENAFWNSESERPSHRGVRPGHLTGTRHLEQPDQRDKPPPGGRFRPCARRGLYRHPSGHALKNVAGVLNGRDVAVVIFDHLHRRAHLARKEVNIDAF